MTQNPEIMTQRPSPSSTAAVPSGAVDKAVPPLPLPAFDALFQALRIKGVVYYAQDFHGDWAMRFLHTVHARIHVVLWGRCWLQIGGQTLALRANDLVLMPEGVEHVLGHGDPAQAALAPDARDIGRMIRAGTLPADAERSARLISGHFEFDPQVRGLLVKSLPTLIRTRARTGANRELVHALPSFMAAELRNRRPGSAVIVERLAEIFLVQVVRAHFEAAQPVAQTPSLMAAFFEPRLNAGLNLMHTRCHEPLTLAQIASEAGMSRSAFAQRFKATTGEMPMAHLAEWRLLKATQLLAGSDQSIAQVAAACGHRSTEGFSRAFKRRHGQSPAQWRATAAAAA